MKRAATVLSRSWETPRDFFKTDVTDGQSVQDAVNGALEAFGAIHVAISCAGIATPMKVIGKNGPMPIDLFNQVIQVNPHRHDERHSSGSGENVRQRTQRRRRKKVSLSTPPR